MANCNEGAAISGMERRKPNCAPDVVANVVAPPGVMVDVNANTARGKSESDAMLWPSHVDGHQLRERIRQPLQIVFIVIDMR